MTTMKRSIESSSFGIEKSLSMLACYAAIELDNFLIAGKKGDFDSLKQLLTAISESGLIPARNNGTSLAYLNASTAIALNWAMIDAELSQSRAEIRDLMRGADELVQKLTRLIENPREEDTEEIKKFRSFCLSLSKRALAHRPSLHDFRPEHPHRR